MADHLRDSKRQSSNDDAKSESADSGNLGMRFNHSKNGRLGKESVSVEQIQRENITEFSRECKGTQWIATLAQVLGEPKYVLTPEMDHNTQHEGAIYYVLRKGEDRSMPRSSLNTIALNVMRHVSGGIANFRIDVRTEFGGERQNFYHPRIKKFIVYTEKGHVDFYSADDNGVSASPIFQLFASGETVPELATLQMTD